MILSRYYHVSEKYSWTLFVGVAAIIGGVVISSFNEINFNLIGFLTALGATVVFCWQNAFSKKVTISLFQKSIQLDFSKQ
jgi:drug/metabolite transporter (DMT)-like permease